jgi:hypothetical protein
MSQENQLDPATKRFKDVFMDVLAEVESTNTEDNDKILEGLCLAFDDWIDYHQKMMVEMERLRFKLWNKLHTSN